MAAASALTPDELLTTTRSVRMRLDLTRPVPMQLVRECLEVAVQAPTGGNSQGWHWVVVTDARLRATIGDYYRRSFDRYRDSPSYAGRRGDGSAVRCVEPTPPAPQAPPAYRPPGRPLTREPLRPLKGPLRGQAHGPSPFCARRHRRPVSHT